MNGSEPAVTVGLAGWLSLAAVLLYPLVLTAVRTVSARRLRLRAAAATISARVMESRTPVPAWIPWIPLGFILAAVNFRLFFFWLPVTERGRELMCKFLLFKASLGQVVISSEASRRAYMYLFSPGTQLAMTLLLLGVGAWALHGRLARRHPELHRLDLDAYFFLLPAVSILAVFNIAPVFYSFVLSLHRGTAQNIFREFVGLEHYGALMGDQTFWISMKNTAWFSLGSIPVTLGCSLFIAMLLNRKIRGLGFYRTVYFLPVITSVAAISLVWRWVYHPQRGVLNLMLGGVGLGTLDWLYDPRGIIDLAWAAVFGGPLSPAVTYAAEVLTTPLVWIWGGLPGPVDWMVHTLVPGIVSGPSVAITAIIVMSAWKGLGYNVIIFLAGLQNIPNELYEAARIDGAGVWRQFRSITWPLLSPTTYFVLIMSTISSFQVFAQIFMLYAGTATDGARVVVYYLFEKGFQTFEFGYASALAYILFLVIFCMTQLQKRYLGEKVHYD